MLRRLNLRSPNFVFRSRFARREIESGAGPTFQNAQNPRMNVILTGATGFVGKEALAQLLERAEVSKVTSIARRALDVSHPKLESLVHEDFTSYGSDIVEKLSDHGACIWALGGKMSDFKTESDYEKVTCTFTLALASVLAASDSKTTFCYLSGMGAEPTEVVTLPWEKMDARP